MKEKIAHGLVVAKEWRICAPLVRLEKRILLLSSGDKLITGTLAAFVIVASVVGIGALRGWLLVSVPSYGGTLSEGVVGSPRFVNPLLALSDSDRDLTSLVYAGLMGVGDDGSLVPVLAQGYEISDDGKTYTFVLRGDAEFSDGTQVNADDVAFTVQKAQDPALKSPMRANWDGVSTEVVDAKTIRFTLPKAYAPFLENARMGILPAKLWKNLSDEEFPFSTLQTEPIGAGPFTVSSVGRNASGIIGGYDLSANSRYVLGRPYLEGINFTFFAQETDLKNALASGRVESAYGEPANTNSSKETLSVPYSRIFGIFFNAAENPAFARLEVRKALSIAIDRTHITKDVLGGYATPTYGPVPPGSIDEVSAAGSALAPSERITTAAAVLEKGGWTYNTDSRTWVRGTAKNREELSITMKTSNVPELKAVAEAARDDWQALGIPVSVELYEPGDLNQNVIRPRKYGALLFGMVIGRDQDLFAFWHSSERNDPGLNISLYANHTVDGLLEKQRAESDLEKRDSYLKQINTLIATDYPAAFTHTPDFVYSVPKDLKGVLLTQIAAPSDRFAGVTKWYRRTESVWPFFSRSF